VLHLAERYAFARPLVNSGRLSVPSIHDGSPLNTADALAGGPARSRPGAPCPDAPLDRGYLLERLGGRFTLMTLNADAPAPPELTGPQAVLTIADTGQGISDEEIARLEAFTQFRRQQNEQQGLGLGLAIAERLTRVYDGDFVLRRTAKGGTEAIAQMPAAPANVVQGAPETAEVHER